MNEPPAVPPDNWSMPAAIFGVVVLGMLWAALAWEPAELAPAVPLAVQVPEPVVADENAEQAKEILPIEQP